MARPRVFITRQIDQEAADRIAQAAEIEVWPEELPPPPHVLLEKAGDIDGLVTLLTDKVDVDLMDAAPRLKVISNLAVGYNNINIAAATRRHIVVGNTPGVLSATTADLAFSLLMAASRRLIEADGYTRMGSWQTWGPMTMLGQDIHNATLGIIGLGQIGAEVAKRAKGFNMRVLYYDVVRRSTAEEVQLCVEYVPDLGDLISTADFISLHVPLLPETHHLIGSAEFALMKPTAVLVNTSRGPVVDEEALFETLKSGGIFAAGIDVTEVEPIPPDSPLLGLKNIIITPHIASASYATRKRMALMCADNLLAGLNRELPLNCVNPEAYRGQAIY